MSVGHQIGDKSHTIGKSYNAKTNEEMDTHDFINLDEGGYPCIVNTLIRHTPYMTCCQDKIWLHPDTSRHVRSCLKMLNSRFEFYIPMKIL